MKIFSNFDTNNRRKIYDECVLQYWEKNVLCFGRSKLYWLLKIVFPTIFAFTVVSWIIYLLYYILEWGYFGRIIGVNIVILLFFLIPIINKYIDYKLDFIVVTPDSLTLYEQKWILSKKVITVNEQSIKTISIERDGFLYSVFNNWDIIFLAEGDVTEHGDIKLKWIPKPEKRRSQIAELMHKD